MAKLTKNFSDATQGVLVVTNGGEDLGISAGTTTGGAPKSATETIITRGGTGWGAPQGPGV